MQNRYWEGCIFVGRKFVQVGYLLFSQNLKAVNLLKKPIVMENTGMHQSKDNHFIPMTSVRSGKGEEVRNDVYYYTNQIVNLIMVGAPGGDWVLIDTGMPTSGKEILEVAEARFGKARPPQAILLTHGHFDHVGGLVYLLEKWEGVPVYAHPLEAPFLTGKQAYPEPDTTVEGGLLAKISAIYPHEPIDVFPRLRMLPDDHTVPALPDWRWYHVPGHSPGQVAFFRERDGVLIAGDAFVTVQQDSLYKVLFQKEEVCGPPRYLTTDWPASWESVKVLEALHPQEVITGHGKAMGGAALREGLSRLVQDFPELAIPDYGKFVDPEKPKPE